MSRLNNYLRTHRRLRRLTQEELAFLFEVPLVLGVDGLSVEDGVFGLGEPFESKGRAGQLRDEDFLVMGFGLTGVVPGVGLGLDEFGVFVGETRSASHQSTHVGCSALLRGARWRPADMELLRIPQFIGTPHVGGSTAEAVLAMGRAAIAGLDEPWRASIPAFQDDALFRELC